MTNDPADPPENHREPPGRSPGVAEPSTAAWPFGDESPELIRSLHLGAESNVRTIGLLVPLMCLVGSLNFAIGLFLSGEGDVGAAGFAMSTTGAIKYGVLLFAVICYGEVGLALRRLKGWALWTVLAAEFLGLVWRVGSLLRSDGWLPMSPDDLLPVVSVWCSVGLSALILSTLIRLDGQHVCSPGYRRVVVETPGISPKFTSRDRLLLFAFVLTSALSLANTVFED